MLLFTMAWMKNKVVEGKFWYIVGVKESISGVSVDILADFSGMGSPHAHLVQFNDQLVYQRKTSGLTISLSGGSISLK